MFRIGIKMLFLVMVVILLAGCGREVASNPDILEQSNQENQITSPTPIGDTWLKYYGGRGNDTPSVIKETSDGEYLIAGGANMIYEPVMKGDSYLLKLNKNGEILWEKIIEKEGYQLAKEISPLEDGGLLISGVVESENSGLDIFLTKLDKDRNEIWSKILGSSLDEYCAAFPLADGGYIIKGNIVDPENIVADAEAANYAGLDGKSNIYISRLDADWNERWTQIFGGNKNVMTFSGIVTPESETVILATILNYPELDDDIYLLKVDGNGDEVWSRTWEEGNLAGYGIYPTLDGGYVLTGSTMPAGKSDAKSDFLLIKVDASGNEIWQIAVGDPEIHEVGTQIIETLSGEYIIAGYSMTSLYAGVNDIALAKVDANGQLVWQHTIAMNNHTMLKAILQHPDGGYLIMAYTLAKADFDILLVKTDEKGKVQE